MYDEDENTSSSDFDMGDDEEMEGFHEVGEEGLEDEEDSYDPDDRYH